MRTRVCASFILRPSLLPFGFVPWFARILRETFAEKPNDAPPPMIMTSPLNSGAGLAEKSGLETADACDTNASEMSADTTAHFIFVARNSFTEASDMVVQ